MIKFIKTIFFVCLSCVLILFVMSAFYGFSAAEIYNYTNAHNLKSGFNLVSIKKTEDIKSAGYVSYGKEESTLMLFGIIPIKNVETNKCENKELVASGEIFGMKMFVRGLIVLSTEDVDTENGKVSPAEKAGIKKGDIITHVNGKVISSSDFFLSEIMKAQDVMLQVERDGKIYEKSIKSEKCKNDNVYKIGALVRDSTAGIGTISFYDTENKSFAALGHAVCDPDTLCLMPLYGGEIFPVTVSEIIKGIAGCPGEIRGYFASNTATGEIMLNCNKGLYGEYYNDAKGESFPLGFKQEVERGDAYIICALSGKAQKYEIEIKNINYKSEEKNLVIEIKDDALLSKTSGIVQGMSGSPIIQNGKIIGVVTHVFIDDPTKGYGIFAENMLEMAQSVA